MWNSFLSTIWVSYRLYRQFLFFHKNVFEDGGLVRRWKQMATSCLKSGGVGSVCWIQRFNAPRCISLFSSSESECDTSSSSEEEGQRHVNPRETFKVNIAPSVLEQMASFENTHKRSDRGFGERVVLTPASGWTSILTSFNCGQHELPCVLVYEEGRITKDPDLAQ